MIPGLTGVSLGSGAGEGNTQTSPPRRRAGTAVAQSIDGGGAAAAVVSRGVAVRVEIESNI